MVFQVLLSKCKVVNMDGLDGQDYKCFYCRCETLIGYCEASSGLYYAARSLLRPVVKDQLPKVDDSWGVLDDLPATYVPPSIKMEEVTTYACTPLLVESEETVDVFRVDEIEARKAVLAAGVEIAGQTFLDVVGMVVADIGGEIEVELSGVELAEVEVAGGEFAEVEVAGGEPAEVEFAGGEFVEVAVAVGEFDKLELAGVGFAEVSAGEFTEVEVVGGEFAEVEVGGGEFAELEVVGAEPGEGMAAVALLAGSNVGVQAAMVVPIGVGGEIKAVLSGVTTATVASTPAGTTKAAYAPTLDPASKATAATPPPGSAPTTSNSANSPPTSTSTNSPPPTSTLANSPTATSANPTLATSNLSNSPPATATSTNSPPANPTSAGSPPDFYC